jgi:hypothetical protein
VLVFTQAGDVTPQTERKFSLAVGLLILGMLAFLLGALGFAAIGAEQVLTANITPAMLFTSAVAEIGFIALIGSFQVPAAIYLPSSRVLFAAITAATACIFAMFDAWSIPTDRLPAEAAPRQSPEPVELPKGAHAISGVRLGHRRFVGSNGSCGFHPYRY